MSDDKIIQLFTRNSMPKKRPQRQNLVSKKSNSIKGDNNIIFMDNQSVNLNLNVSPPRTTVKIQKNHSHIDDSTTYKIKEIVDHLVEKEVASGMSTQQAYAKWYGALKKRYRVTSYTLIPAYLGNEAISWLQQQSAIKRSKISKNNNKLYRNELYSAIYARVNNLGLSKGELYNIAFNKFNKRISSLTQLSDVSLKRLYQFIMGL
ncbi:hypothetical protein [Gallibacterium genomosp. 1]|uniref:Core-binding (CB) domain-containing protein n=1 Tax=Gallibacterium genomosp. 1 TaxID=155515 RepID=A0AB36DU42_9PAST|nr:hypothetical protein [Gallibacterium genomosp. 1]OBW98141.1 hypothetical protein QV04_09705 [Gallibacterium genomosp. 1]OBW98684.1 hypothetical protein QV05_10550 [Gallibacterium genomosp. 1]